MPDTPKSPQEPAYALSIKQPWATLLIHGLKTIEVRRWPTSRRGRVFIHAARVPDPRDEAWALVPAELRGAAKLMGGILGSAHLSGCIAYRQKERFVADQRCHLNLPSWFDGSLLYGFSFTHPQVLPFRAYRGWMRFFPVTEELPAIL
ncbi:MAG TPA: ASCH domain-containing protein [Gemmataceae bacterium]|nr:ASCH domain-containing protein [Gemmataceae bacterium]